MKTPDIGIHTNIPHKDYLQIDAISNSYLSRLAKCPAAALVPTEDTAALTFGRALHVMVLEGEAVFNSQYAVCPKCDKRTKEGKLTYEMFLLESEGKEEITEDAHKTVKDMNESILSHPFARRLLRIGKSEQTIIWKDEETGLICKARPDRIPDNADGVFLDLKTTENASEYAFQSSVIKYGYAKQIAMYQEGLYFATGQKFDANAFIAVEKKPPYRVEVYTLDVNFIQHGYDDFHRIMRLEAKCRERGEYPHYQNPGCVELYAPEYLTNRKEYNE